METEQHSLLVDHASREWGVSIQQKKTKWTETWMFGDWSKVKVRITRTWNRKNQIRILVLSSLVSMFFGWVTEPFWILYLGNPHTYYTYSHVFQDIPTGPKNFSSWVIANTLCTNIRGWAQDCVSSLLFPLAPVSCLSCGLSAYLNLLCAAVTEYHRLDNL